MTEKLVLVTGACGEIVEFVFWHLLFPSLRAR